MVTSDYKGLKLSTKPFAGIQLYPESSLNFFCSLYLLPSSFAYFASCVSFAGHLVVFISVIGLEERKLGA